MGKSLPRISDDDAAARGLGFDLNGRTYFPCPMPGHDGVGHFWEDDGGDLELYCDCHGRELKSQSGRADHHYALSDAFYSVVSGTVLDRTNYKVTGRFVWRLLVLAASGTVVPERFDLALLPADAPVDLHRARDLVVMLGGVRLALEQETGNPAFPMQLSESVVKAWCRVSTPRVTINGLIDAGLLRKTGVEPKTERQARRSAFLYEPVSQATRSLSNRRGTVPRSSLPSIH